MFTWLNKQGVQSDRGFAVQFTGQFTAEYRDHGKVITPDVEDSRVGGLYAIRVYSNAFDHWDGSSVPIPPERRTQMFQNLKEALEFQDLKLVVETRAGLGSL